ncbi:MAG: hypothetical protein EGQ25_06060 [Catenibacterium mitsuokai]|nr:hypothetical protein [Catenibacterium mitsuokai]
MKETRKQKDMFVKIPDNFTEQGLTLEQAYILGRVSRFNDGGLPYYESNKTLAKMMGKCESTVKHYIDELVKEGKLYKKSLPRKRLLSTKPLEGKNCPLVEGKNYPLVEGQNEPYESNKNIGESSMRVKINPYEGKNCPHERSKITHYKDNRIDKLIEETQKPKNRSTNLNDLTPIEKEELLKEAIENMNYRHDEDL